jgi:coenzyme F420 hydrogenase subunit beta
LPQPLNVGLITENDLCISCGACPHACPYDNIAIEMNAAKGMYEPVIRAVSPCETCADQPCLRVCPSFEEDFVELADWTDPAQRIGPAAAVFTGWATDPQTRLRASSGGIVGELCRHYLDTEGLDGIITLRHVEGLDYEPAVYESTEQLLGEAPGSIYHNIDFGGAIEILRTRTGRFGLIASPCQLTSIVKWQRECPEQVRATLAVTIGFICGWMYSRQTLDHFARYVGVEPDTLRDVSYRGGNAVGNLVLIDDRGAPHSFARRPRPFVHPHAPPFRVAFSRTYAPKRCLMCTEHLNYLADIVVGDAWLPRFADDQEGTSIVTVRNPALLPVLQRLSAAGRIALTPASEQDVVDSQGEFFAFSTQARQMANRLAARGEFVPHFHLPYREDRLPRFRDWYRNHLNPQLFRKVTRWGFGYPWFRLRVFLFRVRMHLKRPLLAVRDRVRRLRGRGAAR